jgi:hypothetical protein
MKDASLNISSFMRGEMTLPYAEGFCPSGPIYSSLIHAWEHEPLVECILAIMLPAMSKLLQHMFEEHLPGGKWNEMHTDQEIRERTRGKFRLL